ncbi:MAG: large conductance mechanosensitive channel protein MscL [Chloroflexota bacterium]
MLKEFKDFAMKGNMLDMAVGIIIGAGFTTVVDSLVNDILMPVLGLLLGDTDFSQLYVLLQSGTPDGPYTSLELANQAGAVTLNYGMFVNALINFTIVAFALFMIIRAMNRLRGEQKTEE